MKRSAVGVTSMATAMACLVLAACGAGATTSPPPLSLSADESAVPTGTGTLEPAPAFVHQYMTYVPPGDSRDPHLAVADLNEDGKLDLATTSHLAGVVVLFGRGDGTFDAALDLEVAPGDVVTAADIDGDGHMDLVGAGDQLAVLRGHGDGTFEPPVYYAAGSDVNDPGLNLFGLYVADLNADTIPDLVAANWVTSELAMLSGKGDGTFEPATLYSCPHCFAAAAADLDGDGVADVVVSSFSPGNKGIVYVFRNDGGGQLSEPIAYDLGENAIGLALGDLNGDGALDVVTGNDRSHSLSVLLGRGDGTLAEAQTYPAGNTHTVAVVDLDGDGKLDVLSGSFEDTKVWFYRGAGDGTLIATQGIEVAPDVALSLVAVDLDGDGKLDLALYYSGSRAVVSILLGK